MNIENAKKISLVELMGLWSYKPVKTNGVYVLYHAPYRVDKHASFKVDCLKNEWYDFSTGKGGDIIDLCKLVFNTYSVSEVLTRLDRMNLVIDCQTVSNPKPITPVEHTPYSYKEYRELKKRQTEVVSKEEKEALSAAFSAFWKKLRSEDNAYKELYYAERKTVCKYRSEALRYMIEQYKKDNKAVPTSMIKYSDRSYLLQKGSALELLDKEVNALESVQRELVRKITRAKYGLTEAKEE